jgi:chemotaxis protein CheD
MPQLLVKHKVGVAEMKVSGRAGEMLITFALGSCLGVAVHDPVAGVGGLLHAMLPSSERHPEKALENPFMFVDTGVPRLFQECYRLGAVKERMIVRVAGACAARGAGEDRFQIGRGNVLMLRRLFRKNGVRIHAHHLGGLDCRTMWLEIGSGEVGLRMDGVESTL